MAREGRCRACGATGHRTRPAPFPEPQPIDLDTGRGQILCGICDLPLAAHTLATHPIPELSARRLRSPGIPWADHAGHPAG